MCVKRESSAGGPQGRNCLPWSQWRNINPIGRLLDRLDIISPRGLMPIVAAFLLGALLLFVGQAAFGVFDSEKKQEPSATMVSDAPPMASEPACGLDECDPFAEDTYYYEPLVTVVLGEKKFAKLTDAMRDNLFCLNPTPVGVECDRDQHQRVLRQVLTAEQRQFLGAHGIDSNNGDWEFLSAGTTALIALPRTPTQSYDETAGTVVLMNP